MGAALSRTRHRSPWHENNHWVHLDDQWVTHLCPNLPPCAISEHRLDTPGRAEDVQRLGEAVVIDQARVDGEDAHEEDEVAPMEEGVPNLAPERQKTTISGLWTRPQGRVLQEARSTTGHLQPRHRHPTQRGCVGLQAGVKVIHTEKAHPPWSSWASRADPEKSWNGSYCRNKPHSLTAFNSALVRIYNWRKVSAVKDALESEWLLPYSFQETRTELPLTLLSCMASQIYTCDIEGASLVAQTVKNLLAVQDTSLQSLSQEDPLEKGMATHSSILA